MSYIKAQEVLPKEVLDLIQQYVDGEYLYIPRRSTQKKAWGEKNGSKRIYKERNVQIYEKYNEGYSIAELTQLYYLTDRSIKRIIKSEKCKI